MREFTGTALRRIALGVALAACVVTRASISLASPPAGYAAIACPVRAPDPTSLHGPAHNPWADTHSRLAPAGASKIILCRYSGLNDRPASALIATRVIQNHRNVGDLVTGYNKLPQFPSAAIACPSDDASSILALLLYRSGKVVEVLAGLTGCEGVTNGDLKRTAAGFGTPGQYGPQLLIELERLLGGAEGRPSGLSERQILGIAKAAAARAGDPTPTLIQHSEGTRAQANRPTCGCVVSGNRTSYLIAIRGHFVLNDVSRPPGASSPSGSVLTLVVDAFTGQTTDLGVSNRYPDLAALGPVRTDLGTARVRNGGLTGAL